MLRWLTAGESHGPSLTGIIEGLPAGIRVVTDDIVAALARRRLGYGRGARMKFEQDRVSILSGVRHGITQGGPVSIVIENTEWPKWESIMSADPVEPEEMTGARAQPLTRPRPGHADLTGMRKYGFDDARPVLERASARETATRVALGVFAEALLRQAAGIELVSHVVGIGDVLRPADAPLPAPGDVDALDASPVRNLDEASAKAMVDAIDICHREGDTIGGVVEVLAYGVPAGLGSYVHWDRKLDARLAAALMSIQAMKSVEVGDGVQTAMRRGSQAHDEIVRSADGKIERVTNRAGGIEGGMSNGELIRVRAGMKPISTVPRALQTVDTTSGETAKAIHQRSDVCAVPPAAVVAQAMVSLVLADALLEKTGGDNVQQIQANLNSYLESIAEFQQ